MHLIQIIEKQKVGIWRVFSVARIALSAWITVVVLAVGSDVQAQSIEGTYAGTIACGLLSHLTQPLKTQFTMKVSGNEVTYERPIVRPARVGGKAEPTNSFERGRGTVSPSGEVTLRGQCEGNYSCDAQYQGQLNTTSIRLVGTQRWQLSGKTEERTCEIEVARMEPK